MPSSAELRLEPLAWNFALAGAAYSIASYCSLPPLPFGQALGKLQGKVVTHSFKLVGGEL